LNIRDELFCSPLKEKVVNISRLVTTVLTSGNSLSYARKYFALAMEITDISWVTNFLDISGLVSVL
jgi:hypothetical protein